MHNNEQISNFRAGAGPRHPQQEVVDLIAVALLRLREAGIARLTGVSGG
jgi:hypothetical protein